MLRRQPVYLKGKVVHADADLPGRITCCGIKYAWKKASHEYDIVTCRSCIKVMFKSVMEGSTEYTMLLANALGLWPTMESARVKSILDKDNTLSEVIAADRIDVLVGMLKTVLRHTQERTAVVLKVKERWLEGNKIGDWKDQEMWEPIREKLQLERMDGTFGHFSQFLKCSPEISGLLAALTHVTPMPTEPTEATDLQLAKIGALAATKGIDLDYDIEALSVKDADAFIEWLRTVVIVKE